MATSKVKDEESTKKTFPTESRGTKGRKKGSSKRGHRRGGNGKKVLPGGDGQTQSGSNPKYDDPGSGPKGVGRNASIYWNKHPEMVKAAGNFPFAQALGAPLNWEAAGTPARAPITPSTASAVPGIMTFALTPTYGTAIDETSPLNVVARNLYTFIRHLNSGHTNYDAPNLLEYLIEVDQAFTLYSFAIKIYGTLCQYKVLNRYTPDYLLRSIYFEPANSRAQMAQMLFDLQQWGKLLSSFKVPGNVGVFDRHFEMMRYWWKDSENDQKAQIYSFYPSMIYAWDEPNQQYNVVLDNRRTLHINDGSQALPLMKSWNDIRTAMTQVLNSIQTSEDFNIMSGDIVKAYGDKVWSVPTIDAGYSADPVFNWEMLIQIHNMTILNIPKVDDNSGSTPSTADQTYMDMLNSAFLPIEKFDAGGQLSYLAMNAYEILYNTPNVGFDKQCPNAFASILDVPFDDPTPEDVMEATRLKLCGERALDLTVGDPVIGPSNYTAVLGYLTSYGTEVVTDATIWLMEYRHADRYADFILTGSSRWPLKQFSNINASNPYKEVFTLAPFEYVIENGQYLENSYGTITDMAIRTIVGDLDNHVVIGANALDNLHTAALYSVFGIPENATNA